MAQTAEMRDSSLEPDQHSIKNETPKKALGDRKQEWRFHCQIPHTETKPSLRNAAVPRRVVSLRLTARPPKRLFHLVFESHDGKATGTDSGESLRFTPHHLLNRLVQDARDDRLPPGHVERLQVGDEGLDVPLDLFLGLAF
jgi:hypothetical protein